MLTQSFVKEHLEYRDGHLWWIKPRSRVVKVGQQFGRNIKGYRCGILVNKRYYEHRLIWFYHYGFWPTEQIDHINGIKNDNRIENLRQATRSQNMFNTKSHKNSTSKYKGVGWNKKAKAWQVRYHTQGKTIWLGYHDTEEAAAQAYRDATETIHQEYGNYE